MAIAIKEDFFPPEEILKGLDRMKFLNGLTLQDFFYITIYTHNGYPNRVYVSAAVGKNLCERKKYIIAIGEKELYIVEHKDGTFFRRKKMDGFLPSRGLGKLDKKYLNARLPVYYSQQLDCWVVELEK